MKGFLVNYKGFLEKTKEKEGGALMRIYTRITVERITYISGIDMIDTPRKYVEGLSDGCVTFEDLFKGQFPLLHD